MALSGPLSFKRLASPVRGRAMKIKASIQRWKRVTIEEQGKKKKKG